MSLFDLQDVRIAIGSLATLDLPMVVDLIGIYGLKGPYCFRNKEDDQQQLYLSSSWFTINVQQLVWPKINQLEHNQPADDEDQLQALKSKVNQLSVTQLRLFVHLRSLGVLTAAGCGIGSVHAVVRSNLLVEPSEVEEGEM
ncbi:hypothetical protein F511_38596 [Dorcoceras hygrometricum]|uniref:Uncharacterized protein n=1 Tax=Dorcoceras hygrometricum TaxID=472368 RepID=A0A2Z7C6W9_9LAMI|nr:hypothetical protein F511_38596 [Dorcoceras hygrometricum]